MKIPKNENKEFELCPVGNHIAVCVSIIDLGTQKSNTQYGEKVQRKIMITWELFGELMADGRPFVINNRYTFSGYKASMLMKDLAGWRGAPFTEEDFETFEIEVLLGKGCMLNVIHNEVGEKTYANIAGIARLPKGMKTPTETHNDPVFFTFDEPNQDVFDGLHDWIKDVIGKSPEFEALTEEVAVDEAEAEKKAEAMLEDRKEADPPKGAFLEAKDEIPF